MTEPVEIFVEFETFEKFIGKYQLGGKWALLPDKVGVDDIIDSFTDTFRRFFIDKIKIAGEAYFVVNLSDE